jgi:hypothetical protein
MGLHLLRSMIMTTVMGGKNTMKNTALEEERRRRKKESKRLFWGRRRNSRTYKLCPAIKPLLLVAADKNRAHYFRSQATKVWEEDNRHAIVLIGDALVAVGNAALVLGRVDELSLSYRFIWS